MISFSWNSTSIPLLDGARKLNVTLVPFAQSKKRRQFFPSFINSKVSCASNHQEFFVAPEFLGSLQEFAPVR